MGQICFLIENYFNIEKVDTLISHSIQFIVVIDTIFKNLIQKKDIFQKSIEYFNVFVWSFLDPYLINRSSKPPSPKL